MRIKSVSIQNFRSIEKQTITDIDNALILIGKNNSGKSSIIASIRAFFDDYKIEIKDFPPDQEEIQIKITFEIEENYFQNYVFNPKIGISKFPTTIAEFNSLKVGTRFSSSNHNEYKTLVEEVKSQFKEENNFQIEYPDIYKIWVNSLKEKFKIEDNLLTVIAKIKEDDIETVKYYS